MATVWPLLLPVLCVLSCVNSARGGEYLRVCYFSNWAHDRPGQGKFVPANITRPELCTHIIYSYLKLENSEMRVSNCRDDLRIKEIRDLKQQAPDLKILAAIGGWDAGRYSFSMMAATRRNRKLFIKSAITFVRSHQLDGLGIDWEYPNKYGGDPWDRKNYFKLIKELRRAFRKEAKATGKPTLLLSAGVSARKLQINMSYMNIKKLTRHLDFLNLLAFDFHGAWENTTGENSPLYARPGEAEHHETFNVNYSAHYWAGLGASREKMIIGMPSYGRSFTLEDAAKNGLGAPASGPGEAGEYTQEAGLLAYNEVCQFEGVEGAEFRYNAPQKVPYMVKDKLWVGFDDMRSYSTKMEWLIENKFGGAMMYTLSMDDFGGWCKSSHGKKFPLLEVIYHFLKKAEL